MPIVYAALSLHNEIIFCLTNPYLFKHFYCKAYGFCSTFI